MEQNVIVKKVYAAKCNREDADNFIREYLPFIRTEAAKFIKRPVIEGEDDEYGIAMYAFHEAIIEYSGTKGTFLKFAAKNIKNRLIDYYRKEKRHKEGIISLHVTVGNEEKEELLETIKDDKNEIEDLHEQSAAKSEILEYAKQLKEFGLDLTDIADNCPKQKRTLEACHKALDFAKNNKELLEVLVSSKKLPISKLAEGSNISQKTLERHRSYMVAIMLAYTNGYEIIRGHLCQITSQKEGK